MDNVTSPGAVLSASNAGSGPGVEGDNTDGGLGVLGTTTGGNLAAGVKGTSTGPNSQGVWGISNGTAGLTGSFGVLGQSDVGVGVRGQALDSASGTGVYGSGASNGVYGYSNTTAGSIGVSGNSAIGVAVGGFSASGIGVYGRTTSGLNGNAGVTGVNTGTGPGVVGFSQGSGSIGTGGVTDVGYGFYGGASGSGTGVLAYSGTGTAIWGAANGASGYSGVFAGGLGVIIYGDLTLTGKKSAAVKGADGKLRRLYCVESPESWFEDVGSGQLSSGSATVRLDPGFAGVVKTDQYHIFPVPKGDCKGLYISDQTPNSFTVREQQGGTSSIAFDYRVIAKRKDIEGKRLEPVEEPPSPALPKLPELSPTPATPTAPTPPGQSH
jgi:hypothetical protein